MPIRNAIFMAIPNIHVLNTDDAERLKEWGYKHKIYYIPNFIDPKLIPKKFEVNKNKFVVLFVGRLLTIDKGIDILVNIINKTLAKSKKIQFHIAGNGEDGESLISNLVKKYPRNVKWLGFMNSNKLVKYYRRASIMISTSRSETFGLSVAEAQSNGLPVVAFDVSGIRDIIKKDYQGVLIPKFNADKFAEQVYDYYQKWCNKEISINLKKKISEETVKRYGSKRIFQLLEKMFMEP